LWLAAGQAAAFCSVSCGRGSTLVSILIVRGLAAVAGFSPDEIDITVQENTLLVTGKAQKEMRWRPIGL
jgi:hypothetical protein